MGFLIHARFFTILLTVTFSQFIFGCSSISGTSKNISKISSNRKIEAAKRYFILANEKYEENENDEAFELVEKSTNLNSNFGKAYFLRSKIKFALGDNENACFDIKEGLLFEVNQNYNDWLNSPSGNWCKESKAE